MKAIIFDIDGTLADVEHRRSHLPNWPKFFADMHLDPVIEPVAWLNRMAWNAYMVGEDVTVVVVSARPSSYEVVTRNWLRDNGLNFDQLYMRKESDYRKDSIVKAELLQQIIDDGYEPFLVVDDRPEVVEMWRSYGICTLQCAPDEIQSKHDGKNFLTILVGPAGAGKSTWCSTNCTDRVGLAMVSSDLIREANGWGHTQEDLNKTFRYIHGLVKLRCEQQLATVLDATNLKQKDRLAVMRNVPRGQYVKYLVIDRPLDDKLATRGWRSEELVLKHHRLFQKELSNILNGDGLPNVVVIDRRKK